MPRYDYRCDTCQQVRERVLPITSDPRVKLPCPDTGCVGLCARLLPTGIQVNNKPVSSMFPYVSSRLPFNLPGEKHVGRMRKTLVRNRQHKDRLYKTHGFVAAD